MINITVRISQEKSDNHCYHIFSVHSTLSENRHAAHPVYTTVHVRGRMHTQVCLTPGPDFQTVSPAVLLVWCFRMIENMVRPATSINVWQNLYSKVKYSKKKKSLWMHFISCEMSFLVRSSALWNTAIVNKILGKFMDMGRNIAGREDKPISRIFISPRRRKRSTPKMEAFQHNWSAIGCFAGLSKQWFHIQSCVGLCSCR